MAEKGGACRRCGLHATSSCFHFCCAVQSKNPFTLEDLDAIHSRWHIYIICSDNQERKEKGNPHGQRSVPLPAHFHEHGRIIWSDKTSHFKQSRISNPHRRAACSITHGLRSTPKGFSVLIDLHHASNLQILFPATRSES